MEDEVLELVAAVIGYSQIVKTLRVLGKLICVLIAIIIIKLVQML